MADSPHSIPPIPARATSRGCFTAFLTLLTILGAGGLVVGGAWLSLQLILEPNSVLWVNRFLPEAWQFRAVHPNEWQSWADIEAEVQKAGFSSGEPIILAQNPITADSEATTDVLLPLSRPCPPRDRTLPCTTFLSELRVYRSTTAKADPNQPNTFWQRVDQAAIAGPEESFVIASRVDPDSASQGSSRPLPLTSLEPFATPATLKTPGKWLNLRGSFRYQDQAIAYGQLLYYNPSQAHLSVMLPWASPGNQGPTWQALTGDSKPELVVNQTVGDEPRYQIYQLQARSFLLNPFSLEAIALNEPGVNHPTYRNALVLARAGLWSSAEAQLQTLKQKALEQKQPWPAIAQAQLDVIRFHAEILSNQADQQWADPGRQVFTQLLDGRWSAALQIFQDPVSDRSAILQFLRSDPDPLWKRIQAALRVNPKQTEVLAWGTLLTQAQENREAAIAWLKQQPGSSATTLQTLTTLLNALDHPAQANAPSTLPPLIGQAQPLTQIQPKDWFAPQPLQLPPDQIWYQIQVVGLLDRKQWRYLGSNRSPLTTQSANQLWQQLKLNNAAELQIILWSTPDQQTTVTATLQGIQVTPQGLSLLATGDPPPSALDPNVPPPLAFSSNALTWLEPTVTALSDLAQQQPPAIAQLVHSLWRTLQQAQQIAPGPIPSLTSLLSPELLGSWTVQQADITGNGQPDFLLTLNAEALNKLPGAQTDNVAAAFERSRNLIFSDNGTLIYNELAAQQTQNLLAIARLPSEAQPVLVVITPNGYSLQRWSAPNRQFQ